MASPELDRYVAGHDCVISLVPFVHHADVVRSAIWGKANVITTSYVSPAIRELEQEAKQAGITVLNEVGVDPGVDHLYAIKTIDEVHDKGGKVRFNINRSVALLIKLGPRVLLVLWWSSGT